MLSNRYLSSSVGRLVVSWPEGMIRVEYFEKIPCYKKNQRVVTKYLEYWAFINTIYHKSTSQFVFSGGSKSRAYKRKKCQTCQISVCLFRIATWKLKDSLIWGADNWFIFYFEEFVDFMLLQNGQERIYLKWFPNVKWYSSWWGSPLALTH